MMLKVGTFLLIDLFDSLVAITLGVKMAGNKMSTKTKGRDDKGKGSKGQPSEETDEFDFAHLRKPIKTSVTGFAQARKIFDFATEEVGT